MSSPYDSFAWFYDRYWAGPFHEWQQPALERLLFPALPSGAHVLDLCCGTGALAKQLAERGYEVTGVDSSGEMLRVASKNVPPARFLQADAVDFALPSPVDAVVCTFDSVNHVMKADELELMFRCVSNSLKPWGHFVFDVNTLGAYGENWNGSACRAEQDHAFFLRGAFDRQSLEGQTQVTMFRLGAQGWERSDVQMRQRPWDIAEIEQILRSTGFGEIRTYSAIEELGMTGHYGTGRVYVRACRI